MSLVCYELVCYVSRSLQRGRGIVRPREDDVSVIFCVSSSVFVLLFRMDQLEGNVGME